MKILEKHDVVVYRKDDEFAGWPFNGGFWQFSDGELLLGFMRGQCNYRDENCTAHATVDQQYVTIRSFDGGETWAEDSVSVVEADRHALGEELKKKRPSYAAEQGFNALADGFCLFSGFGIPPRDAPHIAYVRVSTDRGHNWHQAVRLPVGRLGKDGFQYVGGRPSYVVRDDGVILLFAHGSHEKTEQSSVPLVYASWDGGASWGIITEVEVTPAHPMAIMPYPVLLNDGTMLFATRRQYDGYNAYTQVYESTDGGLTWRFCSRVNLWGAPANLVELPDGRIVCVYGYRQKPWGIRARISHDQARSWSHEIILRDDGGSWDIGYPRTILRSDGRLVTAYYFNSRDDHVQYYGGVRHIAATIWRICAP